MSVHFCVDDHNEAQREDTEYNPSTMGGKLMSVWTSQPDREAIVYYDDNDSRTSITNNELRYLCERFSAIVRANGIKKGQVVCNLLSPGIEKEVANFGLILAGVVIMDGSNFDDTTEAFWMPMEQASVKAVILEPYADAVGWRIFQDQIGKDAFVERYTGKRSMTLEKIFVFRVASREYAKGPGSPTVRPALEILAESQGKWTEALFAHDPCYILVERCPHQRHYKLVVRTNGEMCLLAERNVEMLSFRESDIIYNDWPLSWVSSMPFSYVLKGCTMVKSTLVYCDPKSVVRETWDLIAKERCTMAGLQPPMIQMLESHCNDLPEPHWRLNAITTTYQVKDTIIDAIGVITFSIIICYSHIEAGMISRHILTESNKRQYLSGCAGQLHSTVRTQFDLTSSHTPKPSAIGEIILNGRLVVREYYNDDNLTKCSFTADGSFITGDLGYYDEHGNVYIVGRKGDAIIRRQTAIFPCDIEKMIHQCPGVWKVKVVVVRDPQGVQQMCACVVPRSQDALTIDRVKEYCRYQLGSIDENDEDPHMPAYVFFFQSFPLHKGQVHKHLLAQMVSEIIGRKPRALSM